MTIALCESCRRPLHQGRLDHDQQWRPMPARRVQHGKKEATVCWLCGHAVYHQKLAVQFRRQSGRTDIVVVLERTQKSLLLHSVFSFGRG